nr:MAG TPA: hypothetical protein [Caudoviricetes sp.]
MLASCKKPLAKSSTDLTSSESIILFANSWKVALT